MTRKIIGLFACAIIALTVPARTEAQGIKGLIKKKVTEQVKGEEKPADDAKTTSTKSSKSGSDVIEITDAVLEDFAAALKVEAGLRADFKRDLAKLKTPQQYKACEQTAMTSPAAQKIAGALGNLPDNATDDDRQKAYFKMNADLKAEVTKQCGQDPEEAYPSGKRIERMREIETAGADAFDQAQAQRGAGHGPAVNEDFVASYKYPILKERVTAFCKALDAGLIKTTSDGATFQGSRAGINWVFSPGEAAALTARCKTLMPLLAQVM